MRPVAGAWMTPVIPGCPRQKVLHEAALAGYKSIELGPWGYLPIQADELTAALNQHQLSLVAGTILTIWSVKLIFRRW